jgi:hypothetical protein
MNSRPVALAEVPHSSTHSPPHFDLLRDVLAWDIATWSPLLSFWRQHATVDFATCQALEVGAGESGGLSLWLALRGATVTCTSYGGVGDRVRLLHRRYGVEHRIVYAGLDALALDERERFDVIAFKSLLGGIGTADRIDRQRNAMARFHRALRPGANLLFAENLSSTRVHAALRSRYGAGKDRWRYPTVPEMDEWLAPYSHVRCATAGFLGTWGSHDAVRRMSGAVDAWLCRRVIPSDWQYAMFGVAVK